MEFVCEIKKVIEDRVYEKMCQYYEGQEDKPPKSQAPDFEAVPLKKLDLKNIDNSWENLVYIFFAKELPAFCKNLEDTKNLKKHKKGYCLYVGSCRNTPKDRMEHHLGAWWKDEPMELFIMIFGKNIEPEYLNIIEDALWEEYKPLLGKKGPR
jgi:hypothetical protein